MTTSTWVSRFKTKAGDRGGVDDRSTVPKCAISGILMDYIYHIYLMEMSFKNWKTALFVQGIDFVM